MTRHTVKLATRYIANRVSMAKRQDGYGTAVRVGARLLGAELRKPSRLVRLVANAQTRDAQHPVRYSEAILAALGRLDVAFRPYRVDLSRFEAHLRAFPYPRAYAAGPLEEGGNRQNKLLEYFLSLELLDIRPGDVVIDVASEYSIFPTVVRQLCGGTVYRQDLIYPGGVNGDRIGGNAAAMPVSDQFADALVLHNSFEHFEGTADSGFVAESWRILRPGGSVLIVPLFVTEEYSIVTDPLTDRRGIAWDPGARVVELPGWHNRFGRLYSASALEQRVLAPARQFGYDIELLHFANVTDVHPLAMIHFALLMHKPQATSARGLRD
jgi:SAM-dependent methyltransferase